MPVYQAHPLNALLFPRDGEALVAGFQQGTNIQRQAEQNARERAVFPFEMQAAKVKADLLDISLRRSKVENSVEILSLNSEMQKQDMQARIDNTRLLQRSKEVNRQFNAEAAATLTPWVESGNWTAISSWYANKAEEMGNDYGLIAGPWSWQNMWSQQSKADQEELNRQRKAASRLSPAEKTYKRMQEIQKTMPDGTIIVETGGSFFNPVLEFKQEGDIGFKQEGKPYESYLPPGRQRNMRDFDKDKKAFDEAVEANNAEQKSIDAFWGYKGGRQKKLDKRVAEANKMKARLDSWRVIFAEDASAESSVESFETPEEAVNWFRSHRNEPGARGRVIEIAKERGWEL